MTDPRIEQYRRFVQARAETADQDGYLFDTPRCRFELQPSDELVAAPGARFSAAPGGVQIELPGGGALLVRGFELDHLRRVFAALPCSYSRLTIELGLGTQGFLEQTFSKVIFAPAAIAALESRLSSLEIVRFPGSPYEVVRSYWENSCVVRERLTERGELADAEELKALLLELHECQLLGAARDGAKSSFYLPASPLGRKRPTPGRFYETPSGLERSAHELILTSGARVSAPLLGGIHYWQLLGESLNDPDVVSDERIVTVEGVDLGQVVSARGEGETRPAPWFLPPRPLTDHHFAALHAALAAARDAERARDLPSVLAALGSFHYRFVRIHPLPSANQSLSMNFVNAALGRVLGVGMPHLILDQMALRLSPAAYRTLFARLVRTWCAPWPHAAAGLGPAANKAQRLNHLLRMRAELNRFVTALHDAPSLLEARAIVATSEHGARLAGLDPSHRAV